MKKSNLLQLLELHVDKIVLGLVTLISLALLWIYVVGNPYGVEVDRKTLGPGEIDSYVKDKSDRLVAELDNSLADPVLYDKAYVSDYEQLLQSPLSKIASLAIPQPGIGESLVDDPDQFYDVPRIDSLTEVAACTLRGAAQVPTEDVRPDMPYQNTPWELADVDLVTVSAKFNMQSLINSFQQSFTGPRLKTGWKNPALARPVFAQLGLERRELLDNGNWGEWAIVPRVKIDKFKNLLETVPLTTDQLQYDIKICMGQYADKEVQRNLLQPPAYVFAISRADWQPPVYLQESLDIIEKQEDLQKKKQREERANRMESPGDRRPENVRPTAAERRQQQQQQDSRRPQDGRRGNRGENPMMFEGMEDPAMMAPARPAVKRERTLEDVKADLKKTMLDEKTGPETMRESLLLWAHDDTVEPGKTYQYRMRLGVFNPIAGKNWFRKDQAQFKEHVVLWSQYTEPTNEIFIQKRVHVFPTELIAAKNITDGTQGIKIEVAKYNIGQWKLQTFDVFPGQIIGQKAEVKPKERRTAAGQEMGMEIEMGLGAEMMMNPTGEMSTGPQIVDFTTPFTLVDIQRLVTWGASAQNRKTYDLMLYYDPQKQMIQTAIGRNNWDSSLRRDYQQVQEEMDRGVTMRSGGTPMMGGMMFQ